MYLACPSQQHRVHKARAMRTRAPLPSQRLVTKPGACHRAVLGGMRETVLRTLHQWGRRTAPSDRGRASERTVKRQGHVKAHGMALAARLCHTDGTVSRLRHGVRRTGGVPRAPSLVSMANPASGITEWSWTMPYPSSHRFTGVPPPPCASTSQVRKVTVRPGPGA